MPNPNADSCRERLAGVSKDPAPPGPEDPTPDPTEPGVPHPIRRHANRRWAVLAAVAALACIVVLIAIAVLNEDDTERGGSESGSTGAPGSAAPSTEAPASPASPSDTGGTGGSDVTTLQAPAGQAGRCLPPSAELIGRQEVAFAGTVTEISGETVSLEVDRWYAGDQTATVQVVAPTGQLSALLNAVSFDDGGRYLVSASDGRVSVCGLSAPYTDQLAGLYEQAF